MLVTSSTAVLGWDMDVDMDMGVIEYATKKLEGGEERST